MKMSDTHKLVKKVRQKEPPTFRKMTKEDFCARVRMEKELQLEKDA